MTPARWEQATPACFWLDRNERPEPRSPIEEDLQVDLVVVGGGLTGLWTGLQALERNPGQTVVLVEATRIAENASGRNGGFCAASLTHGDPNGRARWPNDMPALRSLGKKNLREIKETIQRHNIHCDLEASGQLDLAVAPWQAKDLRNEYALVQQEGEDVSFLDRDAIREEISSPLALAGLLDATGQVMVDPARLAWGLAAAFESLGGIIAEQSPVLALRKSAVGINVVTSSGTVNASRVVVATSAFPSLVKRTKGSVVPVYDYVLMTEPLSDQQYKEIGWQHRRGIGDAGNQFHYLRLTADNRILFGGYEAVYRFNQKVRASYDQDPKIFSLLEQHFDAMFPSLRNVNFSHRWGGAIDTSTRFAASLQRSHNNRVITVNGFTGLGVGASRFFANAALDLLNGEENEVTRLSMIRHHAIPFPPEPIRFFGITATRHAIARADTNEGKRGLWLRFLDRLGLGFDS